MGSSRSADGVNRAVIWRGTEIVELDAVGESWASDINDSGVIVGNHKESEEDWQSARAFRWRDGELRELPGLGGGPTYVRRLNRAGDAAGSAADADGNEVPVVWRHHAAAPTRLAVPDGYLGGYGMAINDRGDVAGAVYAEFQLVAWGWDADGSNHPLAEIDLTGFSQANVLDNRGRAAGLSDFGGQPWRAGGPLAAGSERSLGVFERQRLQLRARHQWPG